MKKIFFLGIFIVFIYSCSKEKVEQFSNTSNQDKLVIGTFNLEWLGDGVNDRKDRTEEDYKQIALIISKLNPDILGLQEIENNTALQKIVKYLNDYNFYVGNGGNQQNLAIIYKKDIKLKIIGEYNNLVVEYRRTRPGLVFEAKKNNFDFIGLVVHFKSTSRYDYSDADKLDDSKNIRRKQAEITSFWADSILKNGNEKDLVILGDFNDTPIRKKEPTLDALYSNNNLIFITDKMKSCKYLSAYVIDHIVLSQSAFNRYIKGSEKIYNLEDYTNKENVKNISDHCPILLEFEINSPDNDPSTIAGK